MSSQTKKRLCKEKVLIEMKLGTQADEFVLLLFTGEHDSFLFFGGSVTQE